MATQYDKTRARLIESSAPFLNLQSKVQAGIAEFIHLEISGSVVLLVAALTALVLANSPLADAYFALWKTKVGFQIGAFSFSESLLHWINDFLMALFFFVIGLEVKREVKVGQLSSWRNAILPVMAAIGGMVVPALVYSVFNIGGPASHGWGIPVATDIAFALGALAALRSRVPRSLVVFMTALAIGDDVGAILVVGIAYTQALLWHWLVVGFVLLAVLALFSIAKFRSAWLYGLVALGVWFAFFESGMHATIAGVLVAFTIPCGARRQPCEFISWAHQQLEDIEKLHQPGDDMLQRKEQMLIARALEKASRELQPPLQALEHSLHPITTFVILPLFALANAGVALGGGNLLGALGTRVGLGIILGLILGKQIGITAFTFLTVKLGLAKLPAGATWKHLYGVSWLGGIGFTMSLFIASQAFGDPALQTQAKLAILAASVLAGLGGFLLLYFSGKPADPRPTSKPSAGPTEGKTNPQT